MKSSRERAKSTVEIKAPELSALIRTAMSEKGLEKRDIKDMTKLRSNEHARKIVKGEGFPSEPVLKDISKGLKLNFNALMDAMNRDKTVYRHGPDVVRLFGKNPELLPIERVWSNLSKTQKSDAITLVEGWANNNILVGTK